VTSAGQIDVEVVYALRERQELIRVRVPEGSSVADAIRVSRIGDAFPDENLDDCPVGIWGRPAVKGQALCDGDRIELYRPLRKDPREARRELAASGGSMGRRGARLTDRD